MTTPAPHDGTEKAIFGLVGVAGLVGVLWAAGETSARLTGHPAPHGYPMGELAAFSHVGDPSLGWHAPVGPAYVYWAITFAFLAALVALGYGIYRLFRHNPTVQEHPMGVATRREVKATASSAALMARASTLRPSIEKPLPHQVGYRLGHAHGIPCWVSVEDSMLLLGPPRSGKGYNIVIPMILDAPGAVVTTSTRPDNLTLTMAARAAGGRPVAVFDPQGLAPAGSHLPSLRWSPVRGCERPQTAMIRAVALAGTSEGNVENGSFWKQQTLSALGCLLHAAALDDRPPSDLYRWSHAAGGAKEAVSILTQAPGATPGWDRALDAIISAEQRTRDSVWAMVANAFAPLADPAVLASMTPAPGEEFDPVDFLAKQGSLYLLGTATGASATATFVAALIEDIVDAARRLAARSPGARMDPPVALVLDEAANYPLPSLPALMSEGGGSGITTLAVLQSLAQARDKWGREPAGAIWDSAIVKVVLGGLSNADDLADISRLIGEREYDDYSISKGQGVSVSTSTRMKPILQPSEIRRIKIGHGLLLLRSSDPIMMTLSPWTARKDHEILVEARKEFEAAMRAGAQNA